MADVVSLTLEQRALATRAFADALTAELAKLPRLTHEQRDRMMRIAGAIIETGMESGQSADDLIPHFAMLFALARYRPNGRRKTGKHGRPRNVSILYPSKEQKRRIAREKRQDGEAPSRCRPNMRRRLRSCLIGRSAARHFGRTPQRTPRCDMSR